MSDEEVIVEEQRPQSSRPASSISKKSAISRPTSSRPVSSKSAASRPASSKSAASRPASSKSTGSAQSRPGSTRSPQEGLNNTVAWTNDETNPDEFAKDEEELLIEENPPKGCWHKFTHCLCGMWATKDLNEVHDDREVFVRTTLRELIVYCIFLIILCILTFGMTSATMFYYTKVMMSLFEKSNSVTKVDNFWSFLENEMLDGLYWEYLYNDGTDKNFICPGGEERVGPCPLAPSDRNILYENRLLGLPRIRQLRVQNDSCAIHDDFKNTIRECFGSYKRSIEDKNPFGPGYRKKTDITAWTYNSGDQLGGAPASGALATYSKAGSFQNLHSLKNESLAIIKELKEGLWITRGTRFVSVQFTVYNANINLFCIVKIKFEFSPTGGIIPTNEFRTVKLLRYVTTTDYFILACEIIFIMFIIYYVVEEILEFRKLRWVYFESIWNYLDLIVIINSSVCVFLNIYSHMVVEDKLKELLAEPNQYADFSYLAGWSKQANNAVAICVFFSWIKLFKYISFNKTMTQLSSTLTRCAKDVAGFGVMFFIVFFAFAQLGYLLFGTQVQDFSSFSDAIFTLLRTILGDFDFHQIERANRILGPIFFLSYVFFVFFVLLNMFLAIINDTYSEVKADIASQKNEFEIADYMKRGYNNVLETLGNRNRNMDIEHALKLARNADGTVTYDEIRQNLKKCNFSDLEIEMFFARYDNDGTFEFDPNKPRPAPVVSDGNEGVSDQRPLSGKQARDLRSARIRSANEGRPSSGAVGGVGGEEFGLLNRRVDRMEHSVGSIVSKIDAVLHKLEGMERAKAKRRATMGRILANITEDNEADDATKRQQMEELVRKELQNWDESRPGTMESDPRDQK